MIKIHTLVVVRRVQGTYLLRCQHDKTYLYISKGDNWLTGGILKTPLDT
jgi:hypothetical protein